jgi:predicted transcriptional regulator
MNEQVLVEGFKRLTKPTNSPKIVSGIYAGDMLSVIMRSAKPGDLLITVTCNMNTIAVATMIDLPMILFTEGQLPDSTMIERAETEEITLFTTSLNTFQVISSMTKRGL